MKTRKSIFSFDMKFYLTRVLTLGEISQTEFSADRSDLYACACKYTVELGTGEVAGAGWVARRACIYGSLKVQVRAGTKAAREEMSLQMPAAIQMRTSERCGRTHVQYGFRTV